MQEQQDNNSDNIPLSSLECARIDLFVFNVLRAELENKNINFVEFRKYLVEELISELGTTVDEMEKRIFYNIWLGHIDIDKSFEFIDIVKTRLVQEKIENSEIIKKREDIEYVDQDAYFRQFFDIKITSSGLNRIIKLEDQIRESTSLKGKFSKIKGYFETLLQIKKIISITVAVVLILAMWIFDVNINQVLKQIPLLNSIVDTELLGKFAPVDERDDFYKVLKENMNDSKLSVGQTAGMTMQMKKVSNTERVFRVDIPRRWTIYFRIKKSTDNYSIEQWSDEKNYKKALVLPINITNMNSSVVNIPVHNNIQNVVNVDVSRTEVKKNINVNVSDTLFR